MRNKSITFSIITIVFNDEKGIERTIKSVIEQTYHDVEYILIDGFSTDGTMTIVNKYEENFKIIVSEPDVGIYCAMNKGLKLATGDYVLFANSGDYLANEHVFQDVAEAIQNESALPDLVYGNYRESSDGVLLKEIPCYSHNRVWYGMFASHQSIFYRLGMLRDNGISFDESYRIAADYKMTMESVQHSSTFLKLPFCISVFDISGVSCQNQNLGLLEADRVRKELMHMSFIVRKGIIVLSKTLRFMKNNFFSIYKNIRHI